MVNGDDAAAAGKLALGAFAIEEGEDARMKDRSAMMKILKAKLKPLVREHGFVYRTPTTLLFERDNVLSIINYHVASEHMFVNYAMLPLYIKTDFFGLGCGDRLERFIKGGYHDWGEGDEEQFKINCDEIYLLLEENILPLFTKYGSPSGLIRFIEDDVWRLFTHGFAPDHRYEYLAYSYWYLGDIDAGIAALSRVFDKGVVEPKQGAWVKPFLEYAHELIELARSNPKLIRDKMLENVEYSRAHLGIK